jgi:hypothetical protein
MYDYHVAFAGFLVNVVASVLNAEDGVVAGLAHAVYSENSNKIHNHLRVKSGC